MFGLSRELKTKDVFMAVFWLKKLIRFLALEPFPEINNAIFTDQFTLQN